MISKESVIFKWFRRRPWAICWKISCEKRVVHVRWTCVLFNHSELPAFVTQLPSVPIQDGDLRLAFEEMRPSRQLQSHLYSQGRANGERPFNLNEFHPDMRKTQTHTLSLIGHDTGATCATVPSFHIVIMRKDYGTDCNERKRNAEFEREKKDYKTDRYWLYDG